VQKLQKSVTIYRDRRAALGQKVGVFRGFLFFRGGRFPLFLMNETLYFFAFHEYLSIIIGIPRRFASTSMDSWENSDDSR
jgi:hypothetical protein